MSEAEQPVAEQEPGAERPTAEPAAVTAEPAAVTAEPAAMVSEPAAAAPEPPPFTDADLAAAEAIAADDELDRDAPPLVPDLGAEPSYPAAPPLHPSNLLDVRVRLTAELGRARLSVAHVVGLESGAIVDLDRAPEDPVDVYVNGLRYGSGRLVLVGDEWAVRIDAVVDVEQPSNGAELPGRADDYGG